MTDTFSRYIQSIDNKRIKFHTFENVDDFSKNHTFDHNNFNVIHINVRSIRKNWLSLLTYINDFISILDVIVLTEVKITDSNLQIFQLEKFDLYSRCRVDGRGGGLAVYIKSSFIVDRLFFDIEQSEHLCLKVRHSNNVSEIVLSCIYRPPQNDVNIFIEQLDNFLNDNLIKKQKIIILGDYNIDTKCSSKQKTDYLNVLLSNGIRNTIFGYNREEISGGNLSKSCVDHIKINQINSNHF